jgi:ABC-type phosphate/phosphonate transport system ATPase subunit
MAQMVLVMGESGTGKSTSLRNCNPATTAIVNPVGKQLPFRGKFDMLNSVTDARKITKYMREKVAEGKKLIVVDDFQYILAVHE